MRRETRLPPPLAAWILARLLRSRRGEALVGDLAEAYQHGRSRSWYWRQALWAVAADVRERPPWRLGRGALRVLMIASVIAASPPQSKWLFFFLMLDPSFWWWLRRQKPAAHSH